MIEFLKDIEVNTDCGGEEKFYSLDEIKEMTDEVVEVSPNCWLAIRKREHWIDYGLFRFATSNVDGSNTRVSRIFSGGGTGGDKESLREFRHTWWGEDTDGYTFYLPGDAVIAALTYLKKYFDY